VFVAGRREQLRAWLWRMWWPACASPSFFCDANHSSLPFFGGPLRREALLYCVLGLPPVRAPVCVLAIVLSIAALYR
jgi:hypothetical protein